MVTTRSARKGTSSSSPSSTRSTPAPPNSTTTSRSRRSNNSKAQLWAHTPSRATLLWLAVSLPLVVWDSLYVLLRPWTMEGGPLHWPLWVPYKLYGEVDHVYGWKAFRARNGFTAAQGSLNVVETALYLGYLGIYFASARSGGAGQGHGVKKALTGRPAAVAVLLAFSSAVMTLSKTVLYCKPLILVLVLGFVCLPSFSSSVSLATFCTRRGDVSRKRVRQTDRQTDRPG